MNLVTRTQVIKFPRRPLIMGILNINDDSFCSDGRVNQEWAANYACDLVANGADVIDVGAESARTNRAAISEDEEIKRLLPFISNFSTIVKNAHPRDDQQLFPPLLSINTWRAEVVRKILRFGGDILNDIGGLSTLENAHSCHDTGAALLIMHTVGEPKQNHNHIRYKDIVGDVERFFSTKLDLVKSIGLSAESVMLDPGLGFAKQPEDDLKILAFLERLRSFHRPLLLPISRKSFIDHVLKISNPQSRDFGTIACLTASVLSGANILRVHNVNATYLSLKMLFAITNGTQNIETPGSEAKKREKKEEE